MVRWYYIEIVLCHVIQIYYIIYILSLTYILMNTLLSYYYYNAVTL